MGFVAAVVEMLLQSHLPQTLIVLPALPKQYEDSGHIRGLRSRGDVEVSFTWRGGQVQYLSLRFHSRHPWLSGLQEESSHRGFFRAHGINDNDGINNNSSESESEPSRGPFFGLEVVTVNDLRPMLAGDLPGSVRSEIVVCLPSQYSWTTVKRAAAIDQQDAAPLKKKTHRQSQVGKQASLPAGHGSIGRLQLSRSSSGSAAAATTTGEGASMGARRAEEFSPCSVHLCSTLLSKEACLQQHEFLFRQ